MSATLTTKVRDLDDAVARRLEQFARDKMIQRLWAKDPTVWVDDPNTPEIKDRLGWLTISEDMSRQVLALHTFADEIRKSFDRVVLLGMGGSSLAPEVLWRTFGQRARYPSLLVLDSTDPRAVASVEQGGDLAKTLFIVSSKSGTTQETDSFYRYFWGKTGGKGSQFIAITDPDTVLARLGAEKGFRRTFINAADIGGRYSALSYFGLVPAALIGIDVGELLGRAHRMMDQCRSSRSPDQNPGAVLGAVLGEAALAGRDKVTFVLSTRVRDFGLWVEQLIAESTGKLGKGILPVADEPVGDPAAYTADRLFAAMTLPLDLEREAEKRLEALGKARHAILRLPLEDRYDLGSEFFRWEFATAVACAILRVNAFDQPNVAESKDNTKAVLEKRPAPHPPADRAELQRFFQGIKPGDYLAILAYLPPTAETDRRLTAIRTTLRDRLKVATTLGYGPRFLHSTGQLHKGGPSKGHFLQIVDPPSSDLPIPGAPFTFGVLEAAQAEGDLQALAKRGRPVVRVQGLSALELP